MSAPPPIVSESGIDGERFARTGRCATSYRCPVCGHVERAEYEPAQSSGLPPELRDVAAWRQEAYARRMGERAEQIKIIARRAYGAHRCASLTLDRDILRIFDSECWFCAPIGHGAKHHGCGRRCCCSCHRMAELARALLAMLTAPCM